MSETEKSATEEVFDELNAWRAAHKLPPTEFECEKCDKPVFVHVPEKYDLEQICPSCGHIGMFFGY